MVFGDCYYSVLVVSAAEKFNATMSTLLPSTDYYPVKFVTNIAAAKRAYLEQQYDLLLSTRRCPMILALALPPMSHAETALWLC